VGEKLALTDDQCRAMPAAVLIDGVIPQQWSTHELQVWIHQHFLEIEPLGALDRLEVR
jgi:hypothetical protein